MVRGGFRLGAGRPKGQGKFGETTKAIRVPESKVAEVLNYVNSACYKLPIYTSSVSAGFPSPAEDYVEDRLDIGQHLVKNPTATFFVKVAGDSMIKASINDGDILVVDRSLEAKHGSVVIAVVENDLTVKRLFNKNQRILLMPENDRYDPIVIDREDTLKIWGVVTNVIHKL